MIQLKNCSLGIEGTLPLSPRPQTFAQVVGQDAAEEVLVRRGSSGEPAQADEDEGQGDNAHDENNEGNDA